MYLYTQKRRVCKNNIWRRSFLNCLFCLMNRPVTECEGVMLMMCAWPDRCNCKKRKSVLTTNESYMMWWFVEHECNHEQQLCTMHETSLISVYLVLTLALSTDQEEKVSMWCLLWKECFHLKNVSHAPFQQGVFLLQIALNVWNLCAYLIH